MKNDQLTIKTDVRSMIFDSFILMDKLFKLTGEYGNVQRIKYIRNLTNCKLRTAKNFLVKHNFWIGDVSDKEKQDCSNQLDRLMFKETTGISPEEWLRIFKKCSNEQKTNLLFDKNQSRLYYLAVSIIGEWQ